MTMSGVSCTATASHVRPPLPVRARPWPRPPQPYMCPLPPATGPPARIAGSWMTTLSLVTSTRVSTVGQPVSIPQGTGPFAGCCARTCWSAWCATAGRLGSHPGSAAAHSCGAGPAFDCTADKPSNKATTPAISRRFRNDISSPQVCGRPPRSGTCCRSLAREGTIRPDQPDSYVEIGNPSPPGGHALLRLVRRERPVFTLGPQHLHEDPRDLVHRIVQVAAQVLEREPDLREPPHQGAERR